MIRSLEINWLRKFDRSIPIPEVVFEYGLSHPCGAESGGLYYEPQSNEVLIGERYYDLRFGLIAVNSKWPDDIPGTIAHEWRHHWQRHNDIEFDSPVWTGDREYNASIRRHFSSRCERDALLFENKIDPRGYNQVWMDLVFGGQRL